MARREEQNPAVRRLITVADVDTEVATPTNHVSVSARHEAELGDGSRILLLDDRGWGSSADWTATSVADIEETARMVVGPDEPGADQSREGMAANHWAALRQILQRQGVAIDANALRQLPHDVVLTPRLLARIGVDANPS